MLRSRLVRAVGRAGAVVLAAHTVAACYTTVPLSTDARPVGAPVMLDITDAGRVRLANALGESPLRVEGRLTAATDSTYTVAVGRVEGLRGDGATWNGEPYTFRRSDVGLVRLRRVNRGRTALVILGAVGAAVLAALAISLVVQGPNSTSEPGVGPPGGPGNGS